MFMINNFGLQIPSFCRSVVVFIVARHFLGSLLILWNFLLNCKNNSLHLKLKKIIFWIRLTLFLNPCFRPLDYKKMGWYPPLLKHETSRRIGEWQSATLPIFICEKVIQFLLSEIFEEMAFFCYDGVGKVKFARTR